MSHIKKFIHFINVLISGGLIGWFLYRLCFDCVSTEVLYLTSFYKEPSIIFGSVSILITLSLIFLSLKYCKIENLSKALCPALTLAALFTFPMQIWSMIIMIPIISVCIFRMLLLLPVPRFIFCRDKYHISFIITLIITVISIIYSIWIYDKAWRNQYLFFFDWGMFVEPAMNTLRGEFMMDYFERSGEIFFSRHFQPGFFSWFIPLMWLFPYPQTVMVVGALFLSGSAILIFYFARIRKLPPFFAFCCSMVYLLYPTITNYNLSLFHGFHVIYFFIPVFILFCCLYEKKKLSTAFLVFIFSLTIKETVGAFWVGWGLCQFISGHRKRGIIYALIGGVYLIICMKLIIPSFTVGKGYMYMDAFGHLGDNMWEIALSPILRPNEFWNSLLVTKKIMLILLLVLPIFMGVVIKPFWVGCGAVTLVFIFMRRFDSLDNINLYTQHTVEISTLIILSFIAATSYTFNKKSNGKVRLFTIGMPEKSGRTVSWALLASGLFCSISAYSQLAQGIHTKNHATIKSLWERDSQIHIRDAILSMVPSGSTVGCDMRTGSLMIASGLKVMYYDNDNADFYFYDFAEKYASIHGSPHSKLLKNPELGLIWIKFTPNNSYYLFKRNALSNFEYPLRRMPDEEWLNTGRKIDIPQNNDFFEVHLIMNRNPEGQFKIVFSIKVLSQLNKYYKVSTYFSNGNDVRYFNIPFAYAMVPPDDIKAGEVFQFEVTLPAHWTSLQGGGCKIEEMQ